MTKDNEEDTPDKRIDQLARKARLVKGAGSTLATTIILTSLYEHYFKEEMDGNLAVALSAMVGSMGTGFVLCFHDFRALLCGWLIRKRFIRNRRKP